MYILIMDLNDHLMLLQQLEGLSCLFIVELKIGINVCLKMRTLEFNKRGIKKSTR